MDREQTARDVDELILMFREQARQRDAEARRPQITRDHVRQAFESVNPAAGTRSDPLVISSPSDIWKVPDALEEYQKLINAGKGSADELRAMFEACLGSVIIMRRDGNIGPMTLVAEQILAHGATVQRAVVRVIPMMFLPMTMVMALMANETQSTTAIKNFTSTFKDIEFSTFPAGQSKKPVVIDALQHASASRALIESIQSWEDTGEFLEVVQ